MMNKDNPKKNRRLFTCRCTSDICVVIQLNHAVFDILIKEQLRKERETLAQFIHSSSIPGMNRYYTLTRIMNSVSYVF